MKPTLTQLITNKKNRCVFHYLRAGHIYYRIGHFSPDGYKQYVFPIPLDDTGNGTFNLMHKPVTLMRWIRKAINNNQLVEI